METRRSKGLQVGGETGKQLHEQRLELPFFWRGESEFLFLLIFKLVCIGCRNSNLFTLGFEFVSGTQQCSESELHRSPG